jgi:myo-inositol-1(or 4)-monophosphatase
VREAGAIARKYFRGDYKAWRKSDGNPVTEVDIEIDQFLKSALLAARPNYGWLSEESADDPARLSRSRIFIVDPIDGTHGFLKHRPQFTIVAAVVEHGRPAAAAIYNPITDEMFDAVRGAGARMNGTTIHVSTTENLEGSRLLTNRMLIEKSPTPWPPLTVETRSSIAYRMALVAKGEFDAMISLSEKSEWDVAAGDLIVQEAGGRVTSQDGSLLLYNKPKPVHHGIVCAGASLHTELLSRLRDLPADAQ